MARDETIKLSLIDGVTRSLASIQKGVGGVGAELAKLNQVSELAAKGFGLIGDAIDGISGSVKAVGGLEAALARVSDITGATAAEQVALQEAVNNAVSTLGVAADQAAGALVLMAEDGFSASEAVGSLNTVLAFAKANAQDAATATQALGGVLDTFGEKPAIIAQLADQLTAASRAAGVGTVTLQNGLAAIGVQAEQAGLGVSEATAALAALASRGIEGTQAAKQLGTVLTELNNPASAAGKALDEAGLKGKSFAEIVDVLSKDAAKAAPILEALGNRPRAALKVLLADGGGALREFNTIVANAGNASADAAAKIDETFNGALARLQATIDNLRNQFLAPILQPLADEFARVSEQLNGLADSPQFARLRAQFQEFATGAIQSLGQLVAEVDLQELTDDIVNFGSRAKQAFDALVLVVETTASAIRGIALAIDFVKEKADEFAKFAGIASDGANKLNVASQGARRSLDGLGAGLDKNKKSTRDFATGAEGAASGARAFATAADDAGAAAGGVADDLQQVPPAAKLTERALGEASVSADEAGLALAKLQGRLLQVRFEMEKASPGSAAFQALAIEAHALEGQIVKTKDQIDKAAGSTENLADKADRTAGSLRNMAGAAREAGSSAGEAGDSASSAGEKFGNIGEQAASAAADLGNMSASLIELALQQQSEARSGREIIKIWEGITRRYEETNKRIEQAIDLIKRRNEATSEEAILRRTLEAQYGTESTKLEELVQLKLRENEETKRAIELKNQETEAITRRAAATAGALGTQAAAPVPAITAATGGRGSAQQGGGDRATSPQIVINVQGMTSDQAREFVARSVVPELERINRLGR